MTKCGGCFPVKSKNNTKIIYFISFPTHIQRENSFKTQKKNQKGDCL